MSHRFFGIIHCWLLRYGKTNSVVKDGLRSALSLARARKPSLHGSHRSTRTSASVDADIRIGRRRHPRRSAQTSASVGADVLIGGYGIPAIPTQPPPRHPHAATPRHPHATILLADCVGIARMLYPPIDSVWVLLLCLTFEHKLVSDIQIAVEIQSGVSVVEVGAGLTAIEEVERTGWRYVQTFG